MGKPYEIRMFMKNWVYYQQMFRRTEREKIDSVQGSVVIDKE